MTNSLTKKRYPWLAVFFSFGAVMCGLTTILMTFPGTALDSLWRLNPSAQNAFESIGSWAIALMLVVGVACLLAAIGLATGAPWGVRLAVSVLCINAAGDLLNTFLRHDYRALIGVPIAGMMIWWLARSGSLKLNPDGSRA